MTKGVPFGCDERRPADEHGFALALADVLGDRASPAHIASDMMQALATRLAAVHCRYLESGDPRDVDDARIFERCADGSTVVSYRKRDGASIVAAPVLQGTQLAAVLVVEDVASRVWSRTDIELIEHFARAIGASVEQARLIETLVNNEAQFRTIAENMPAICWLSGPEGRADWMNRRGRDFFGDNGGAEGDGEAVIHPDDFAHAMDLWAHALNTGTPVEVIVRNRGADGAYRPFLNLASPIRDASGTIVRWCGIQIDRSEQEAQDRRQSFLRAFHDRTRDEGDPARILTTLSRMLAQHLEVSQMIYSESDGGDPPVFNIFHASDGVVFEQARDPFRFEPAYQEIFDAYLRSENFVVEDYDGDHPLLNETVRSAARAMGVRSGINVPIVKDGRVVAALAALHDTPRRWTADEIALCEDLAERTWSTVTRAHAESALQERERHQALLLDWSDRVRTVADPDTIVAITLETLAKHLGVSRANYSEGDPNGETFTVLAEWCNGARPISGIGFPLDAVGQWVRDEFLAGHIVNVGDVLGDGRIEDAVKLLYAETDALAMLSIPLVRSNRVRAVLSVQQASIRFWTENEQRTLRDLADRTWVTLERARAEAELLGRERDQAFLLAWSDSIRSLITPDAILSTTIEQLGRFLGATHALYSETDASGMRMTVAHEWRAVGDSLVGRSFAIDEIHETMETLARINVPLVRNGRIAAVLSVQQDEARRWTEREFALARDIADRTWTSVERVRAEAEIQHRERQQAFLLDWSDRVRGESSSRGIVATTLASLGEYLGVTRLNYVERAAGAHAFTIVDQWSADGTRTTGQTFAIDSLGPEVSRAYLAGEVVQYDDAANDPRIDDAARPHYNAVGAAAFVGVPLVRNGVVRAVIVAHQAAPRQWQQDEIRLMQDIADRIWALLERATAQSALQESEAQLAAFLENAPVAMHLKDAEGRFLRVNPELATALGCSQAELLGAHPASLFAAPVAGEIDRIERAARLGQVATAEFETGMAGSYASVLSIVFPVTGSAGIAQTGGFTLDQTERKAAEAALTQSREALYQTEKLSALGSLLAGVSHELNNPLSIVVAQAVMMERQSKGSEIAERATKIRKAADRCARIVQTFLAMARQKRPEREPVDLNVVTMAALDLAGYGLRSDGITVRREFAAGLPLIPADADQLHQIVVNLVINAQQAMAGRAGERALTITTALGSEPNTVSLDIADSGPGIPREAHRRIFEPFFTTKPQGEGTGVGLSFSQGLAEAHGGRLVLMPSPVGACFRLTLPIDEDLHLPREVPTISETATKPVRRALVIDDEGEIAESLADFLSIEGFDCTVAVGGAAATAQLAHGEFDLVVSDLRMPEVDGPAVFDFLRAQRPDLAGRIAFTTGDTLGTNVARFIAEAGRPVLEKPFTPDAVRRLLDQMDMS